MKKEMFKLLDENFKQICRALYPASDGSKILNDYFDKMSDRKVKNIFMEWANGKGLLYCHENF